MCAMTALKVKADKNRIFNRSITVELRQKPRRPWQLNRDKEFSELMYELLSFRRSTTLCIPIWRLLPMLR